MNSICVVYAIQYDSDGNKVEKHLLRAFPDLAIGYKYAIKTAKAYEKIFNAVLIDIDNESGCIEMSYPDGYIRIFQEQIGYTEDINDLP